MSIATALQNLILAKADIKAAINEKLEDKGITVPNDAKMGSFNHYGGSGETDFGYYIRQIEAGTPEGIIYQNQDETNNNDPYYFYQISAERNKLTIIPPESGSNNAFDSISSICLYPSNNYTISDSNKHLLYVFISHAYSIYDNTLIVRSAFSVQKNGSNISIVTEGSVTVNHDSYNKRIEIVSPNARCDVISYEATLINERIDSQ